MFLVNGGAVRWRSGQQSTVAQSTMESEYIAAAEAVNEAVWLRKFFIELGVFPGMQDHENIYWTTQGPLRMLRNRGLTLQPRHTPMLLCDKAVYQGRGD